MSQEVTETNDGFIVGVDAREPIRTSATWAEVQNESMGGNPMAYQQQNLTEQHVAPTAADQRFYTDDDLERVRREEKDKLYGRIQTMDEQLKAIQKEREAAEEARLAEIQAEVEKARSEEEEKMETRELLQRKEAEWTDRFSELETRYEQDRAVFERERRFNELEQYRNDRIAQESEYIIPNL